MEKDQQNQSDSVKKFSDGRAEPAAPPPPVHNNSPGKPVLRVKFKIPTIQEPTSSPADPPPVVAEEEEKEEVKDHCCVECHKRFSSGKALGGHMSSAHVQANRDFPVKKLKSKMKKRMIQFSGSASSSGEFTCRVCFKDFPVIKSLFGHMRCHPEREWRGMDPPVDFPAADGGSGSSNVVADDDDDDQINYDPPLKWVVRGKRGRPATKPGMVHSSSPASSDEIVAEEEILAVQQLVRLVNGQPKVKEGEASSSNSWIPQCETDHGVNQGFQLNKQKEKMVFNDDDDDERVCVKKVKIWDPIDETPFDEQLMIKKIFSSSDDQIDQSGTKGSLEKTPETPPDLGLVGPTASPEKYICSTCGKRFPSPQALGGHRSSHKKFKMRVYNTIDHQSFHGGSTSSSIIEPKSNANASKQLEVSNVLGDQIQCNCIGGECNHPAVGHVTAIDEAKKESKVLFDLNELPSDNGDDGVRSMKPHNNTGSQMSR